MTLNNKWIKKFDSDLRYTYELKYNKKISETNKDYHLYVTKILDTDDKKLEITYEKGDIDLYDFFDNYDLELGEYDKYKLLRMVLMCIKFFHDNGFYHRDIKMENIIIFVDQDDCIYSIKLCDLEATTTKKYVNKFLGTRVYAPPEYYIKDSKVSAEKHDIYALGYIIYFLFVTSEYMPFGEDVMNKKTLDIYFEEETDEFYKKLLKEIFSPDPIKRPSIDYIIYALDKKYSNKN